MLVADEATTNKVLLRRRLPLLHPLMLVLSTLVLLNHAVFSLGGCWPGAGAWWCCCGTAAAAGADARPPLLVLTRHYLKAIFLTFGACNLATTWRWRQGMGQITLPLTLTGLH